MMYAGSLNRATGDVQPGPDVASRYFPGPLMPDEPRESTTVATRKTDRRSSPRRAEYIVIECITPQIDGGRHPVKRIVGDRISVGADLIQAGHDTLAARVMYMGPGDTDWLASPMLYDYDTDRWYGAFVVDRIGRWKFTIEA